MVTAMKNALARALIVVLFFSCRIGDPGEPEPTVDPGPSPAPRYSVTTFAGSYERAIDATGVAARFAHPLAVYRNGTDLYVADSGYRGEWCAIRKVDLATGRTTTYAGNPGDSGGGGEVDGVGAAARFMSPGGITGDGQNLYVADTYHNIIRKIVIATGAVTTIAGQYPVQLNSQGDNVDGAGTEARFFQPRGIATDGTYLYVTQPYGRTIRRIDIATGDVITYAGTYTQSMPSGTIDGYRTSAVFVFPNGIAVAGGCLFVCDKGCIRKIDLATGMVSTIAGDAAYQGNDDGIGAAARFYYPRGIATDGSRLFVTDDDSYGQSSTVRKIENIFTSSALVSTIAGGYNPLTESQIGWEDGIGTSAYFFSPQDIATDGTSLYVADTKNNAIREIDIQTGAVTTLAGHLDYDGNGSEALFDFTDGITDDGVNLYVSNSLAVRKITPAGDVTTFAGSIAHDYGSSSDAVGQAAGIRSPGNLIVDGDSLYVLESGYNAYIRKIERATALVYGRPSFAVTPAELIRNAKSITSDEAHFYLISGSAIIRVLKSDMTATIIAGDRDQTGYADGSGTAARFYWPSGILRVGNALYVADSFNRRIRKLDLETNAVSTVAGNAASGIVDGIGDLASFIQPAKLATDGETLYIAEYTCVRRMDLITNEVETVAGSAAQGYANGEGDRALFFDISGITVLGDALYVTEVQNSVVRRIQL